MLKEKEQIITELMDEGSLFQLFIFLLNLQNCFTTSRFLCAKAAAAFSAL